MRLEFAVADNGPAALFAEDDPRDRTPAIGWHSRPYDTILYQEDFEYHHEPADQLDRVDRVDSLTPVRGRE